jgi:3-methylcrotonyl-CoA carboxylase alpha subunit
VLIKAVAGGGGKGMRRVEEPAEFEDALESAKREAVSSFGDDRVLIEKYISSPRHIEVQVFGDSHGNVVHLFERDCSLQRRHQKVIEEAPAPGMDGGTREAVCGAAVRAAKAVSYENAGTIEFIADASEGLRADRIWFMEMNTRLQVEHPVTEEITGQDLVEWQLRVASGEKLPKTQDELSITGHAIEARLYAEDPARGFLPSVGRLKYFELPPERNAGSRTRIETGYKPGAEVSPFYDPMIAKIVVWARSRTDAIRTLALDCSFVTAWPVKTNAGFLYRICEDDDFNGGNVDTGLLADHAATLIPAEGPSLNALEALAESVLDIGREPTTPWETTNSYRVNAEPGRTTLQFNIDGERRDYRTGSARWAGRSATPIPEGYLLRDHGTIYLGNLWREDSAAGHGLHDGEIEAPMPGKVTAVEVKQGEKVAKGQRLLTLEAMKMEHALTAPFDGTVAELNATPGAQVTEGQLLVKVTPEEPSSRT